MIGRVPRRLAIAALAVLAGTVLATAHAGTGIVSPRSLTFEARDVGSRSASQSVFVRNPGPGNMTVDAPRLSGEHAGDFSLLNGCPDPPSVLGEPGTGGSECSIAVIFSPQGEGPRRATLTVTVHRQSGTETFTVALSGAGTATGRPAPDATPALGRVVVPARISLARARARGVTVRLERVRAARLLVRLSRGGRLVDRRNVPARARIVLGSRALRRRLRAGRYELSVTPTSSSGRRGAQITRRLRIVG
jgi:hypothetical protein